MGFANKRLMILGAGPSQLSGILAARALGCGLVTVDYAPGNPGHRHGDAYENCDIRDADCVLGAAVRHGIDGILTFCSDVSVSVLALVAERLGLPGVPSGAAGIMTDKALFRAFQRQEGLPAPACVAGMEADELFRRSGGLAQPLLMKPVDGSGSRGVTRLEEVDRAAFARAFRHAQAHSLSGRVCVEEAVPGEEAGGDAFLHEGRLVFLAITRKRMRGVLVTGHCLPGGFSAVDRVRVATALTAACAGLGYRSGPLNFDVMLAPAGVTILELSPRNGGNGLTPLIRLGTGFDMERAMVIAALGGDPPPASPVETRRSHGVVILGSGVAGRLARLPGLADLRAAIPEVLALECLVPVGSPVEVFGQAGQAILRVYFDCAGPSDYGRLAGLIEGGGLVGVEAA